MCQHSRRIASNKRPGSLSQPVIGLRFQSQRRQWSSGMVVTLFFHLSPRLFPSTAGCSPPSMSSIVLCLLLSCFIFHLGFVHPLHDVALHQCLPLSSVAFLIQVVPSFLVKSSCHLLLGHPLDLFPLLGCHSVQRLVHLLSFISLFRQVYSP